MFENVSANVWSLTFDLVSYYSLCEVSDISPGVSPISAADVAQSSHVPAGHQLIGL